MSEVRIIVTAVVVVTFLGGCGASLKDVGRTIDDVANVACEIFGTQNPAEFQHLIKASASDDTVAAAEKMGWNVKQVCAVKEIVQPFIDDQLRLQAGMKASARATMGASDDGAPPE